MCSRKKSTKRWGERELRIRRYLPEAVIVLGALYCAGVPIYGETTIRLTSALYIAVAVVLALALMLPRPVRTKLALVLASLGTALLLAEVYFQRHGSVAFGDQAKFGMGGRPVDLRSRVAVVRDLRAQGVDAVPRGGDGGCRTDTDDRAGCYPQLGR